MVTLKYCNVMNYDSTRACHCVIVKSATLIENTIDMIFNFFNSCSESERKELNAGIKSLKNGKMIIKLDNISVEEIKNFGLKPRKSLLQFFNNCLFQQMISKIWRRTKVVALLKPAKDCLEPKSYRPISLLSHLYKLLQVIFSQLTCCYHRNPPH